MNGSATRDRAAFLALSAELTGFDVVELEGTGVTDVYLAWLQGNQSALTARLLDEWSAIEAGTDPAEREAQLRRRIMGDADLGPFARDVLTLWYTAQWGSTKSFAEGWAEGLVWKAGLTHPTGAKATGFASWASPPAEAGRGG